MVYCHDKEQHDETVKDEVSDIVNEYNEAQDKITALTAELEAAQLQIAQLRTALEAAIGVYEMSDDEYFEKYGAYAELELVMFNILQAALEGGEDA